MADEQQPSIVRDLLSSPRSRAQALKGAAVAAAGLALAPTAVLASNAPHTELAAARTQRAQMESAQTILNIAATAEALAVTAFYNVHEAVVQGKFDTTGIAVPVDTLVTIVRAILREEQDHYAFVVGAGGRPAVTSFTLPAGVLSSALDALHFVEVAETTFVAAYMAAVRDFAKVSQPQLAQYAYQIGAVEAEHRALARAGLGEMPPNNKSFESNLYTSVSAVADELTALGLFQPGLPYPGAGAVDSLLGSTVTNDATAGVVQRQP